MPRQLVREAVRSGRVAPIRQHGAAQRGRHRTRPGRPALSEDHCLWHGGTEGSNPSPSASQSVRVYTSQDRFSHLHSFEAEGVAEVEFEADVRGGLRRFFYAWSGDAPAEA